MREYETVREMVETRKLKRIVCNGCGKEVPPDWPESDSVHRFMVDFGYGSRCQ